MDEQYDSILEVLDEAVDALAQQVPPPRIGTFQNSYVYRYVEKTPQQALVQKLARVVSGLRATRLLVTNGFLQEQASLQRMLDELTEDIHFLAYAEVTGQKSSVHRDYLEAFYQEEFDGDTAVESSQRRPNIPRRKIRDYVVSIETKGADRERHREVSRTISKTYSGYVHAASPQLMEMYQDHSSRFQTQGMLDSAFFRDHAFDLWNYFYRAILACAVASKAIGDDARCSDLVKFAQQVATRAGR